MVAADFDYIVSVDGRIIIKDKPVFEQPATLSEWEVVTNRGARYVIEAECAEIHDGVFQFYVEDEATVTMPLFNVEYISKSNKKKGDLR